MLDKEILSTFEKIEKGYNTNKLDWGNYASEIDWNIIGGKLETFVKNTSKPNIHAGLKENLARNMRHDLRDGAIVSVLKKINVKTVLDIGADTGMFLARCKCEGIEGVGIEPNKEVVDYVNKKNYVKLFCFDLDTLMREFKNNNCIEVCSMLNTFHGEWKDIQKKDNFTKYLARNFKYAVLSDDYKNNKPDSIVTKYFDLLYDFNMFGMASLREHKAITPPFRKIKKSLNKYFCRQENQIYKKNHILSVHKLYIPKKGDI